MVAGSSLCHSCSGRSGRRASRERCKPCDCGGTVKANKYRPFFGLGSRGARCRFMSKNSEAGPRPRAQTGGIDFPSDNAGMWIGSRNPSTGRHSAIVERGKPSVGRSLDRPPHGALATAFLGLVILLFAAVLLLIQLGLAPSLAALIVAVALFGVSGALAFVGIERLKSLSLTPRRTLAQFTSNLHALRASLRNEANS